MLKNLAKLHPESFLGTLVRLPLRFIPRSHVAAVKGGINKGARWVVGSSIHGWWLGTYEYEKQTAISRLLRPGMVVWDVGANAGFYTLAFSKLVGDAGKVYAFEPLAENANNLLRHVRLNGVKNVQIIQAALGKRNELIGFSVAASNCMGHISQHESSYLVPTLTVDDFVARFPEARPNLLKIDIEGAEGALLTGADQLLRQSSPDIFLALHGEAQSQQCTELLRSRGYSLYYLDGSPVDSMPLKSDEIYARKRNAAQQGAQPTALPPLRSGRAVG